jgi:hypothetical protein
LYQQYLNVPEHVVKRNLIPHLRAPESAWASSADCALSDGTTFSAALSAIAPNKDITLLGVSSQYLHLVLSWSTIYGR